MRDFLSGAVAALLGALAMWVACAVSLALDDAKAVPVYIAHDCDGAGGDLWATDESDFPTMIL